MLFKSYAYFNDNRRMDGWTHIVIIVQTQRSCSIVKSQGSCIFRMNTGKGYIGKLLYCVCHKGSSKIIVQPKGSCKTHIVMTHTVIIEQT